MPERWIEMVLARLTLEAVAVLRKLAAGERLDSDRGWAYRTSQTGERVPWDVFKRLFVDGCVRGGAGATPAATDAAMGRLAGAGRIRFDHRERARGPRGKDQYVVLIAKGNP